MIENILIVDTETTGLSSKTSDIIELACILYNVKHKCVLQQFSSLFPCKENPVEHINNIKSEWTQQKYLPYLACEFYLGMYSECDAIVGHNLQFDIPFIESIDLPVEKTRICTKKDFNWPVSPERKRLQDYCNEMGVEYLHAHRALSDCNFLAQCFTKIPDLFERFNPGSSKDNSINYNSGMVVNNDFIEEDVRF